MGLQSFKPTICSAKTVTGAEFVITISSILGFLPQSQCAQTQGSTWHRGNETLLWFLLLSWMNNWDIKKLFYTQLSISNFRKWIIENNTKITRYPYFLIFTYSKLSTLCYYVGFSFIICIWHYIFQEKFGASWAMIASIFLNEYQKDHYEVINIGKEIWDIC